MAVFRYRLQSLLNIKNQLKTQAEMEFSLAQARLTEEEERLAALKRRRSDYMEEGRRIREDELDVRKLKENERAIKVMDDYIEGQTISVRMAARAVEAAREKLTEAMKEVKVQERLRERAFEQFLEEEKHTESMEINELVSYRYGQKETDDNGS
jgi:flagellar FliJ protein